MSTADLPDDPGLPADRARDPAQLLDELRLRLDRLPENHPSARRESAWGREVPGRWRSPDDTGTISDPAPDAAGRSARDRPAADSDARPDGRSARGRPAADSGSIADERAEPGENGADGSDGPETGAEAGSGAESGSGAGDRSSAAGQADLDWQPGNQDGGDGWLNAGRSRPAEAEHPWFMSGEPGAPWFAAELDPG
jgi:hypothetical protein